MSARVLPREVQPPGGVGGLAHRGLASGFSLLELLIVVSVTGIILAMGVPSFKTFMVSNRLSATANTYVSAYNEARLQVIRSGRPTQFCSNVATKNGTDALGAACGTSAGAAYVLDAGGTSATKIHDAPTLPDGLVLGTGTSAVAALRYNSQGFARAAVGGTGPYTGLLLDLSASSITINNRRCLYLTTGSIVSSCVVTSSGACPSSEPSTCQN
ncbi:MAG: prepilin-type N-terminal cleavage/methylation domain-containing protein [Nevskiaceae bacterium]|nr:MAG: prepilin-type N-terminal cleavage/methylation domain-containing protein [Nevskiaceae bacterium]TAM23147.1 MAG: prepilin-type N-terminal cleavage/methylation domain-containing protein [Nevskiaceae bacterium]